MAPDFAKDAVRSDVTWASLTAGSSERYWVLAALDLGRVDDGEHLALADLAPEVDLDLAEEARDARRDVGVVVGVVGGLGVGDERVGVRLLDRLGRLDADLSRASPRRAGRSAAACGRLSRPTAS